MTATPDVTHLFFFSRKHLRFWFWGGPRWAITWRFLLGSVDRLVGGSQDVGPVVVLWIGGEGYRAVRRDLQGK
jgi:hypothetical protein